MATLTEAPVLDGQGEILKPYVPRLLIEWVRETPHARYRAVDGSLAFVDISGFTALTERLARRGKIGAELMRDTLDGVFRALLDEAYDWGAHLLKWGGDALLLLFDGPEHPARAARAAWEMQRTIERVGRLRVAGGTVTLRMSIGITTGTIEFFTGGSVHRELLIAGPAATETVTIEAIADAGEIGISHALAACLDPACVGPPKEQALLLAAAPEAVRERAPDVGYVRGLEVASCIPVAARAHVLLDRPEPEHRTITAAFIDLMDTDVLLARLGPDAFAEALDERICAIEEAALRYDVPFYETDIGKGSVKALLTAGAPSSTGHDEEQMLRALREVMDEPGTIPMRVGVNTGKVFTGDFGPPYRRAYRVFGDAINTAARVMSRAEAGQILSTEIVLERSRTTFETTPIEPFKAKGKAELVRASVVGPVAGRREERGAETPLVGRDAELGALLSALDDVRHGRGWVLEVSGAAGTGKSRLVHELVERCPDVVVLRSRCEEYEASTPYYALRAPMRTALGLDHDASAERAERQLRDVVARVDPSLVPWVPLLGILLGLDLPPTPETERLDERFLREAIADATMHFLVSTLAGTPTLLAVEDVHFMDEASADLLRRISRASAGYRHALLVTHADAATTWSPTGDEELRCLALTLLPLSETVAAEIVALATDDDPLPPHAVEEIARRSAGNVLFLFELLDTVRSTGSVEALPDSVEAVIAGDIDRLSPTDRTVLRYASVLGASFDPTLLGSALRGEAELDDGVWERLGGLVDPDPGGGMRFHNTLVRDAAYEGLPFRRRRELHGRVAEAIEAKTADAPEEEVSALALHWYEAQRPDRAWHYCRLAGDRARAVAANVEAARFYERALTAARRLRDLAPAQRAQVWRLLGGVRESAGDFAGAYDALRRATALLRDDPVSRAQTYEGRGYARLRAGAYPRALREATAGLRLVSALGSPEADKARARLLAQRAEIKQLQGHPREAVRLALQAADDAKGSGELEALARAYTTLDGAYQMLGEFHNAVYEQQSIEIWSQLGRLRSVGIVELNLGVQAYSEGRWGDAVDWYRRAYQDCNDAGDRQAAAIAGANLGEVLISRGAFEEAESVLTSARRVLRASGLKQYVLWTEAQLGRLALEQGRTQEAFALLARLVEEAEDVHHAVNVLETCVQYASAATAAGHHDRALDVLDKAARDAGDEAVLYAVPIDRVRGTALIALGRLEEAAECLERALAGAVEQSMPYEQLLVMRQRATLARDRGEAPSPEEVRQMVSLAHLLGVEPLSS